MRSWLIPLALLLAPVAVATPPQMPPVVKEFHLWHPATDTEVLVATTGETRWPACCLGSPYAFNGRRVAWVSTSAGGAPRVYVVETPGASPRELTLPPGSVLALGLEGDSLYYVLSSNIGGQDHQELRRRYLASETDTGFLLNHHIYPIVAMDGALVAWQDDSTNPAGYFLFDAANMKWILENATLQDFAYPHAGARLADVTGGALLLTWWNPVTYFIVEPATLRTHELKVLEGTNSLVGKDGSTLYWATKNADEDDRSVARGTLDGSESVSLGTAPHAVPDRLIVKGGRMLLAELALLGPDGREREGPLPIPAVPALFAAVAVVAAIALRRRR